jgi:hypothetical protein
MDFWRLYYLIVKTELEIENLPNYQKNGCVIEVLPRLGVIISSGIRGNT